MKKKIFAIAMMLMSLIIQPEISRADSHTPILRTPSTTIYQMQEWAIAEEATDIFIELAPTFYNTAVKYGIDPTVIYTQSAKETNFMKFTGVVTADYHNPCGLKITEGGGDKEITAHKKFASWEEGITAMAHHLALYAGHKDFPMANTPDPRHFPSIYGKAKYVEDLGGRWAPSKTYGNDIVEMMDHLRSFPKERVARLSGSSRYETAIRVSKYLNRLTKRIVIASGDNFPDALVASSLAHNLDAPILLTKGDSLPYNIRMEIQRTQAHYVTILGGTLAVSANVENQLKDMGLQVQRIAGNSRYNTAIAIAEENQKLTKKTPKEAILVNGEQFADSLSIASYAGENNIPIYLTNGNSLTSATKAKLTAAEKVTIIGGNLAVSSEVENQLKKAGVKTERIFGTSRYDTAVAVAQRFHDDASTAIVASGMVFPDSLVGATLAIKYEAPIILTKSDSLSSGAFNFMTEMDPERILVLGGNIAVNNAIFDTIRNIIY